MFITLAMIAEAMKDYQLFNVEIKKGDRVSAIRILMNYDTLKKGILYLSEVDEKKILCQTAEGSSFYVAEDIFTLLNELMSIFDYYNQWNDRLLQAIDKGSTLTELLNLSYPVIAHPLTILDANEWEIAHSEHFQDEEFDPDWSEMLKYHTSDPAKIATFNQKYYNYFNLKNVYCIPGSIFGSGYACNLFHYERFCGIMIMAEPGHLPEVSQGELDAMQYLCEIICNMIRINSYDVDNYFPEKPFVEYLAKGDHESLGKLERSLKILSWESSDPKWLIFAEPSEAGYLAPMPSHSKLVFNRMDGIVTVEYETGLVFLSNLRIQKNREQVMRILSERLRQISYCGGSSGEFFSISDVGNMLQQAKISLKNGTGRAGNIHLFEDAVIPYLVTMLKKIECGIPIHPCIGILRDYDLRNGNRLYETLYSYLKNERKISDTLMDLNIPRSTLLNRLQRINEVLPISLDHPETRLHILLSYMLDNHSKPIG